MAQQLSTKFQPLCLVAGCENVRQQKSVNPLDINKYLKTCRNHTYKHLEKVKSSKA